MAPEAGLEPANRVFSSLLIIAFLNTYLQVSLPHYHRDCKLYLHLWATSSRKIRVGLCQALGLCQSCVMAGFCVKSVSPIYQPPGQSNARHRSLAAHGEPFRIRARRLPRLLPSFVPFKGGVNQFSVEPGVRL